MAQDLLQEGDRFEQRLFLGSFRAALVTASIIPLSLLFSFVGMKFFGISANLMSLGTIDFGMIVDGAVVMIENSVHRMQEHGEEEVPMISIATAGLEVARPMAFGVGIIIAVYLPILFLEGLEGRMFRPMAITVCTALLGSLLLALTVIPVLSSFVFRKGLRRKKKETNQHWMKRLSQRYIAGLSWVIRHRIVIIAAMAVVMIASLASLAFIGTEFMPRLDEGSILVETRKLPGVSLTDSIEISKRVEKTLRAFPEIEDVTTKIGRPDFATEAMGINEGDVYVALAPPHEWKAMPHRFEVARTYLVLGIEHILTGVDHLLFVSGLLLLVSGVRRLLLTVSAFTLSHTVTLTLATLGFVHVPAAPVEAVIALSILFVAWEVLRKNTNPTGLAQRKPWLVAFSFGLLHGLGFASGLSAAGLPTAHIPLALGFFSAGVEVGHFSFVGAALLMIAAFRRRVSRLPSWSWRIAPYAIGSCASFWLIARLAAF